MSLYGVYIISKSGSLLYQYKSNNENNPLRSQGENDHLVIASNIHGLHAIAAQLTPPTVTTMKSSNKTEAFKRPANNSGLRFVRTDFFSIYIDQTVTGLKFILFTSNEIAQQQVYFTTTKIYNLYCDYVMKNPWYKTGMPIRIKSFDEKVQQLTNAKSIQGFSTIN